MKKKKEQKEILNSNNLKITKKGFTVIKILSAFILVIALFLYLLPNILLNNKEKIDTPLIVGANFNTNEGIIKNRNINGISFTSIKLVYEDDQTKLSSVITNKTGNDYFNGDIKVIIKDKDNNILISLPIVMGDLMKDGTSQYIETCTNSNVVGRAYSLEFVGV